MKKKIVIDVANLTVSDPHFKKTGIQEVIHQVLLGVVRNRHRFQDKEIILLLLDVGAGPPGPVELRAGQPATVGASAAAPLRLVNDSDADRRFVLEQAQPGDLALGPGRLLSFQEFRDLFPEEYLSADVQLAIGEQTILFTDIVGSTAMYAQRGDPAAFSDVKRHFTDVYAIVGKHRGAVVKTIGDAAMAAFNDPLDAVKASQGLHACFHPQRADLTTRLRISINVGPCIAVKLNTAIDYFGHTGRIHRHRFRRPSTR